MAQKQHWVHEVMSLLRQMCIQWAHRLQIRHRTLSWFCDLIFQKEKNLKEETGTSLYGRAWCKAYVYRLVCFETSAKGNCVDACPAMVTES